MYIKNSFYRSDFPQQLRTAITDDEKHLFIADGDLLHINVEHNLSAQTPTTLLENGSYRVMISDNQNYLYVMKEVGGGEASDVYFTINDYESEFSVYERSELQLDDHWSPFFVVSSNNQSMFSRNQYHNGIIVADISDIDSPKMLDTIFPLKEGNIVDVGLFDTDTKLCVSNNKGGIVILDVLDRTDIKILDTFVTEGHVNHVEVHGNGELYAFIENENNSSLGLFAFTNGKIVLKQRIEFEKPLQSMVFVNGTGFIVSSGGSFYRFEKEQNSDKIILIKQIEHQSGWSIRGMYILHDSNRILIVNEYKIDTYDLESLELIDALYYAPSPG